MKLTKTIVRTTLAAALAGAAIPATAIATAPQERAEATALATQDAGTVQAIRNTVFDDASLESLEGKWFRLTNGDDAEPYPDGVNDTICFKYQRSGSKLNIWVEGTGKLTGVPKNDAMFDWMRSQKGYEMRGWNGTLHIGAGITRIEESIGAGNMDVRFAEGSQLTYIGYEGLAKAKSVNLEVCTKLKEVGIYGLCGIGKTVTVPASVEKWGECALQDTKYKLASPTTMSLPPYAIAASSTADSVVANTPKVKLSGGNKVTVSWDKPFKIKGYIPSDVYSKKPKTVPYAVRYKVQYRVKGATAWKRTGMVKSKSKTLTMLKKGAKYQVRVAAYKKANGKWKALCTTAYKTTAAVKGYNPKPKLTASESSVKATWAKVPGATKYKVSWKAEGGSWKSKTVKGRSCTVKGLEPGKAVQVTVTAYKGKKGICKSTAAKATTKQAQATPPADQPETPAETPAQ